MIEINLLPEEMRRAEGTPLPRFLALLAVVLLTAVGLMFTFSLFLITAPDLEQQLVFSTDAEQKAKKDSEESERLQKEITELRSQKDAFEQLERERVLYGRVLWRIMRAVPDGCWLDSLRVAEDKRGGTSKAAVVGGKIFRIDMHGFAAGADQTAQAEKYSDFLRALEKEFGVVSAAEREAESGVAKPVFGRVADGSTTSPSSAAEVIVGGQALGAFRGVFEKPKRVKESSVKLFDPESEYVKLLDAPTMALEFDVYVVFQMPSASKPQPKAQPKPQPKKK